jgi:hypothetical protein
MSVRLLPRMRATSGILCKFRRRWCPMFLSFLCCRWCICRLFLTMLSSLVAGYTAYIDPLTKWHELKAAALDLEAEIWKFRCR